MKRLCALILLLACLALSAQAAPPSYDAYDQPLSLPFVQLDSPALFGPLIFRLTAPNGQELHVTTDVEQPQVFSVDVDFDGQQDLAVMVSSGATNSVFRFFLLREGRYVPAEDPTEEGLFNPAFYPGARLVGSHGTSGEAGALHEDILFRWEGNRLVKVRRALCEHPKSESWEGTLYTQTTSYHLLKSRVYKPDDSGFEEVLLHEETHDMEAQGMEEAYQAFYQREQAALWEGLGGRR